MGRIEWGDLGGWVGLVAMILVTLVIWSGIAAIITLGLKASVKKLITTGRMGDRLQMLYLTIPPMLLMAFLFFESSNSSPILNAFQGPFHAGNWLYFILRPLDGFDHQLLSNGTSVSYITSGMPIWGIRIFPVLGYLIMPLVFSLGFFIAQRIAAGELPSVRDNSARVIFQSSLIVTVVSLIIYLISIQPIGGEAKIDPRAAVYMMSGICLVVFSVAALQKGRRTTEGLSTTPPPPAN